MLEREVASYINSLGLSVWPWKPNTEECASDFCLVIVKSPYDTRQPLYLTVAKHSTYYPEDRANRWMEADDMSWVGPLRYVMAWCAVAPLMRGGG